MAFRNILTGETNGSFHNLEVMSGGTMTDILTLIGSGGGGGGGGAVQSAQTPLSISSGILSLDATQFCVSATGKLTLTNGQMRVDLSGLLTSSDLATALSSYVLGSTLSSTLGSYATSAQLQTGLSGKASVFSVQSPLSLTSGVLEVDVKNLVTSTALNTALSS